MNLSIDDILPDLGGECRVSDCTQATHSWEAETCFYHSMKDGPMRDRMEQVQRILEALGANVVPGAFVNHPGIPRTGW